MKFLSISSRANKASLGGLLFLLFTTHAPSAFADGHSPHSFSANVMLTSDYVYRGISQTDEDPALQGGFDYSHASGLYLGVWASNVEFGHVIGGDDDSDVFNFNHASLEIDVYGGMTGEFANGLSWDVGATYYAYPDSTDPVAHGDFDFLEFSGSLSYTWDIATADIGVAYSADFFGEDDEGVWWHGGLGLDMGVVKPYVKVGHQDVEGDVTNPNGFHYTYYAVGASTSIDDKLTFDLSWQDADLCGNIDLDDDDICEAFVFSVSSEW